MPGRREDTHRMWTFLSRDGYVRAWILAWLLVDVSILVAPPLFGTGDGDALLGSVLLLPLAAAAHWTERRRFSPSTRRFAHLLLAGVGWWWLASVLGLVMAASGPSLLLAVVIDSCSSLFYLALFLALESRVDGETGDSGGPGRRLEGFGAIAMVIGLFAYFVIVPALIDPATYRTSVPSLILSAALALFLAGRFLRRCLRVETPRWRLVYRGLFATTLLLAVVDGLALTERLQWLTPSSLPGWDLLRHLPILALLATARLHSMHGEAVAKDSDDEPLRSELGSPLVAGGFCFPILHYGLYIFDLLEPASRPIREHIVFAAVLIFSSLAMLENARLRQRSLRLARRHRETARLSDQRSSYLNSLIENSPLAIVVLDAEQAISICNPAFEKLFGYRQQDIEGQYLDNLISDTPSRRDSAEFVTQRVITGEAVNLTAQRRHMDGRVIDVEIHGVPLFSQGKLSGVYAIYQDIGDRLHSEQALRESEERFRLLAEASFEGIVVSDGGKIRDANEQYARMLGLGAEELLGRNVLDFVAPEDQELVREKLEEGFVHPYDHRALRADGTRFLVEVHGRTLPYEGRPLRVTTVRDITEQKRLEEETRQSQKMEVVGRLAGSIAHDFNNILTIITGYGQLLAAQLADHPLAEMAEEIRQAARRASLLTQRLLDFSRKRPVQAEEVGLNDLLRGMEKMMRRLLPADIELHLRLDAQRDVVRVDPGQMEQMVLNLIVNAGDAMPRGGLLTLTTFQKELGTEHRVAELDDGSYVCLEVRDTGSGMDKETLQHAFDPFFTTKERGKGTGLGLSTVYNIVRQNHGGITVDSELSQGTTFHVYLARVVRPSDDLKPAQGDVQETPEGARDGATVLVVEDESGVRRLAAEYLDSLGYQVIEASDGRQALRWIEGDRRIQLVLTDMVMPEMNGPEMVEKALALRDDLRVLYMTGYADEHVRQRGVSAGSYILQKPFSFEDLAEKVRETLDAKH